MSCAASYPAPPPSLTRSKVRESIGITRELRGINGYEEHPSRVSNEGNIRGKRDFYQTLLAPTRAAVVCELVAQMRNVRITHDYDWNAVLPSLLITSLLQPLLHISIIHKED